MLPLVISVKIKVKLINGIKAKILVVWILIIKAIIPGKNEIKVRGVKALCASLNVLELLAIAIHKPLIKKE